MLMNHGAAVAWFVMISVIFDVRRVLRLLMPGFIIDADDAMLCPAQTMPMVMRRKSAIDVARTMKRYAVDAATLTINIRARR